MEALLFSYPLISPSTAIPLEPSASSFLSLPTPPFQPLVRFRPPEIRAPTLFYPDILAQGKIPIS
ncbi:hypothetical protein DSO57_1018174 [Entomophthora muscae]|uniref:Uncharacterized protein n=1 Tax=Entomophthora muscae TaxID=34485 RepID=A0ACC2UP61_9FUNG|nr:hypothetical protein DSO57_1018174 [Entomophthora muscae]